MKHTLLHTTSILLFFFNVSSSLASVGTAENPADSLATTVLSEEQIHANNVMVQRLEEIKAMDKADLTRTEKKALRQEVKTIKHELTINEGGVYVSVGALLIIILLLIILL